MIQGTLSNILGLAGISVVALPAMRARAGAGGARLAVTWMTCVVDQREHAVAHPEFEAGLIAGHGCYLATCDHVAFPGALVSSPGPRCTECAARQAPRASPRPSLAHRLVLRAATVVVPSR
jgi:hypothetical protein